MLKTKMVSVSRKRHASIDVVDNIEGSTMFEDDVNTAIEKIEESRSRIVGINYKFAVDKNHYIYTALIVYAENSHA